jgi:hypothetical protein
MKKKQQLQPLIIIYLISLVLQEVLNANPIDWEFLVTFTGLR